MLTEFTYLTNYQPGETAVCKGRLGRAAGLSRRPFHLVRDSWLVWVADWQKRPFLPIPCPHNQPLKRRSYDPTIHGEQLVVAHQARRGCKTAVFEQPGLCVVIKLALP